MSRNDSSMGGVTPQPREVFAKYVSHGRKGPISAVGYLVDCTLALMVIGKSGELKRILPYDEAGEQAAADSTDWLDERQPPRLR